VVCAVDAVWRVTAVTAPRLLYISV
jgi:hypothetical protein